MTKKKLRNRINTIDSKISNVTKDLPESVRKEVRECMKEISKVFLRRLGLIIFFGSLYWDTVPFLLQGTRFSISWSPGIGKGQAVVAFIGLIVYLMGKRK